MEPDTKVADDRLLSAVVQYGLSLSDPGVARFHENLKNWGDSWQAVTPLHLPASDRLAQVADEPSVIGDLLRLFARERASRKWEQSYRKEDNLVGDDMLAGYGFAEVIGKFGLFVSDKLRCGIGVWGPNIHYPLHRHGAEEIYAVLQGGADFQVMSQEDMEGRGGGEPPKEWRRAGEVVYVPPHATHGFTSGPEGVVVYYLWQNSGDLRERSSFS